MFGLVYSWHAESGYRTGMVSMVSTFGGFWLLCVTVVHFTVIECMCSLSLKALACITLLGLAVVA